MASGKPETNGYYNNPQDIYYSHIRHYDSSRNDLGNVVRPKLFDNKGNPVTTIPGVDVKAKCQWGKDNIDATQSTTGDGQKFRGRGMKQLTGRVNYATYWVFRGWLKERNNLKTKNFIDNSVAATDFDARWWDDAKLRPAPIDDPHRVGNDPYTFVDSGGWYWEAGATPNGYLSINKTITGNDITPALVKKVTKAINGKDKIGDPTHVQNRYGAALFIADKLDDNVPLPTDSITKDSPKEDGLMWKFKL